MDDFQEKSPCAGGAARDGFSQERANERIAQLEARLKELQDENGELSMQIEAMAEMTHSLEAQLQNIRNNRFYRLAVAPYKVIRGALRKYNYRRQGETAGRKPAGRAVTEDPLVSVIVPVYNCAEYIGQCLDSILGQTYSKIELVVVDDCSPDRKVGEILKRYEDEPRVKLMKNACNMGISETMNRAMIHSTGEWIAFVDCDDWLERDAIEKTVREIVKNPDAAYVYTNRYNCHVETGERELVDFSCRPTFDYESNLIEGMYTSHLKVIRRDVFQTVGLHDSAFDGVQDYDLALKVAHYMGDSAFLFVREPLYNHRIHKGQTTQVRENKMTERTVRLRKNAQLRRMVRKGAVKFTVSFVILSFEKVSQTIECVESIRKTVKTPYEIILWDNHSGEKTVQRLREAFESSADVSLHFSDRNLGCGGGRMAAVRYAKGEYVVFLDNDILVTEDWLTEMIVRIRSGKDVAAVNAKVIFPDGNVQINGLRMRVEGDFVTYMLSGANVAQESLETCKWMENDWINGGATLYRREVFAQLDGLNLYPNAFEDNDASMQMRAKGYTLLNSPASRVIHNHINFQSNADGGKKYREARYNADHTVLSALLFYTRNRLIINDEYVFSQMGLDIRDRQAIRKYFRENAKARVSEIDGNESTRA